MDVSNSQLARASHSVLQKYMGMNKLKVKRINGAAKRRLKWLMTQGRTYEEARSLCLKTIEERGDVWTPKLKGVRRNESAPGRSTPLEEARVGGNPENKPVSVNSRKDKVELFKVGVLPTEFPFRLLTRQEQMNILDQIEELVFGLKAAGDSTRPSFRGSSFSPGYLELTCADKPTADWLKARAGIIKLPDTELNVVDERDIPSPQVVRGYFPNSAEYPNSRIATFLENQNENLPATMWRCLKKTVVGQGVEVEFAVDQISMDSLQKANFLVNYRFGQITLYVNKGKGAEKERGVQQESSRVSGASDRAEMPNAEVVTDRPYYMNAVVPRGRPHGTREHIPSTSYPARSLFPVQGREFRGRREEYWDGPM